MKQTFETSRMRWTWPTCPHVGLIDMWGRKWTMGCQWPLEEQPLLLDGHSPTIGS